MKKFTLFAVAFILMSALCACGRKDEPKPTAPQSNTQPSTVAPSLMPELDPTLETNIPDPTVNENSQGFEDMDDNFTDSTMDTSNPNDSTDNHTNKVDRAARSRTFQK